MNTKEGPTKDEILKATKDLRSPNPTKVPDEGANAVDVSYLLGKSIVKKSGLSITPSPILAYQALNPIAKTRWTLNCLRSTAKCT